MTRLLLRNLVNRLRDWWFKPKKGDVPRWTLKQILALVDEERDGATGSTEAGMVAIIVSFAVFAIVFAVILLAFTFWQLERKL